MTCRVRLSPPKLPFQDNRNPFEPQDTSNHLPINLTSADISDSLEKLVAESKQQASTGAGLPVAEHGGSPNAALVDEKEIVRTQLDALVDRVKGLRKLTAEGALFLPLYELRRAQEVP